MGETCFPRFPQTASKKQVVSWPLAVISHPRGRAAQGRQHIKEVEGGSESQGTAGAPASLPGACIYWAPMGQAPHWASLYIHYDSVCSGESQDRRRSEAQGAAWLTVQGWTWKQAIRFLGDKPLHYPFKMPLHGFPWCSRGKESTCQCRRREFSPWSGKIPHAPEQLSPSTTAIKTVL